MQQQAPMQQGQMAQNYQQYQTYPAQPQAGWTSAPNTYSYPTYGGYYGSPYNNRGWNYGYGNYYGGNWQ
jgi:hypothetical protein